MCGGCLSAHPAPRLPFGHNAQHVFWSESEEYLVLATEEVFFVLRYDQEAVAAAAHATGDEARAIEEEGVASAFELIGDEINERVRSGAW